MTMTDLGKFYAVCAVVGALLIASAPQAIAQNAGKAPVIALVNYTSVLQESKAGKSVNDQIVKQRETYLAEIKKVTAALEKEAKELEQQQSVLAQDVLEGKITEFRRKQLQAKQTENGYRRSLDQMQANGLRAIEVELDKILQAIALERGIDIVMKAGAPNSLILKAREEFFITDDVIKALDKKLPKVTIPPVAQ
jgi:Skp family chaperone for outer membrane proteins